MTLHPLPTTIRDLYEAVDDLSNACERFHVATEVAEQLLPDDSQLKQMSAAARTATHPIAQALQNLAQAISAEAHRLKTEQG